MLSALAVAAAFVGRRSVVLSVKMCELSQQVTCSGGALTNPTFVTPGIAATASTMRLCTEGALSSL